MHAIKTITKFAFLGALLLGWVAFFVGGVAGLFIWPTSNLGPPAGAVCGVGIGVPSGAILGCIYGFVRSSRPSSTAQSLEKNDPGH